MGHGTEHHLEHAEHSAHAAHDPFDRRVAMSMAIIAAALAGVTLLSHRGHTKTLQLTTQANIYHTQASILHTEASDGWNFYQAKNIRSHEFQAFLMNTAILTPEGKFTEEAKNQRKYWKNQVEKYEGKGYWDSFQDYVNGKNKDRARGKDGELAKLKKDAEKLVAEARGKTKLAKGKEHESHEIHGFVNFIDYGHLAIELALVLCSVAVLTKQRGFWFSGILVAVLGLSVASVGVVPYLQAEMQEVAHSEEHHDGGDHKPGADHKPAVDKKSGGEQPH